MTFLIQVLVVSTIALSMTIGVYGLVAGIVKIDDAGLYLMERKGQGAWLKVCALDRMAFSYFRPMADETFDSGGYRRDVYGGRRHSCSRLSWLQEGVESLAASIGQIETVGPLLAFLTPTLCSILIGIVAGGWC